MNSTSPMTEAERKQRQRERDSTWRNGNFDTMLVYQDVGVAVMFDNDGLIWFRGVDLAKALKMKDPKHAVYRSIDKKYKKTYAELMSNSNEQYHNIRGMQPRTMFVNEKGMHVFMTRSRKPEAKAFVDWFYTTIDRMKEELKQKDTTIDTLTKTVDSSLKKILKMQPNCVPQLADTRKNEYVLIARTWATDGIDFPYYVLRRQQASLTDAYEELRNTYPLVLLQVSTPNGVNFFNFILENMPGQIIRERGNKFALASGVSEEVFMRSVKNLYRTAYGIDPSAACAPAPFENLELLANVASIIGV